MLVECTVAGEPRVQIACGILQHKAARSFRAAVRGLDEIAIHTYPEADLTQLPAYDIFLVDTSTASLCLIRAIRDAHREALVCCLEARSDRHAIQVMSAGADVVLYADQSNAITAATLRAAIQRTCRTRAQRHATIGDLVCDRESRRIRCGSHVIDLSPREWSLFDYLLTRTGRRASTEELRRAVFPSGARPSNALPVYVGYLRRKLRSSRLVRVVTLRGFGYALEARPHPGPSTTHHPAPPPMQDPVILVPHRPLRVVDRLQR
ncbi:MAG: response regulator transcription factor [Gemmatimonas sp.]|jgi:DNA-binding response OmpR family regulator|nr:response regulator transcription factor [Gemmatimonas sp.]